MTALQVVLLFALCAPATERDTATDTFASRNGLIKSSD